MDRRLLLLRAARSQAAPNAGSDAAVAGEYWGVHGGGFYRTEKYRVTPRELPEPLHWFKWEAYTTWLTGFGLLVLLYYLDSDVRLIDPAVADLDAWEAITISVGSLAVGWLAYDLLCRFVRSELAVAAGLAVLVVAASWTMGELLAPRAAYLQVGAILGTIMAANVLLVIIPAQRELVRAKEEGREADAVPGLAAKRRSVHNNYLTLPVVFTMLAGHFAFMYGHERAWLALVAAIAIAVLVRHFFNLWHQGRRAWWIPVTAVLAATALAIALEPDDEPARPVAPRPSPPSSRSWQSGAPPATRGSPHRTGCAWRRRARSRRRPTRSPSRRCVCARCRRATRPA